MPIFELFSKRQKKLRGEVPDVYEYENIPKPLRVQIVHIMRDALGRDSFRGQHASRTYKLIHDALCREYGLFRLGEPLEQEPSALINYFLSCSDHERVLDIIELSFHAINTIARESQYQFEADDLKCKPDDAINELNARFQEHGVGFQFESDKLIRVDSQFLHSDAVKPALILLGNEKRFEGANEEFLKAHEHYRNGRYKECLVDALKSFESVMKAICDKQKWAYGQNHTAQKLISVCFSNGLVPGFLQTQFTSIKSLLESGVPTVRNKLGGHGQGTTNIQVTESIASYALHLAASNIVFLAKLEKENFS
jgi:hypothetical protein